MTSESGQDIYRILREHGLSPSVPRVAIYTWLMEHPVHPTVEELYKGVRPQLQSLSLTTVYNVLKALVACGLVQKVFAEDLELRYDANVTSHAHFKCTTCGKIFDLGMTSEDLPHHVTLPEGFTSHNLSITLWGHCPTCHPTPTA